MQFKDLPVGTKFLLTDDAIIPKIVRTKISNQSVEHTNYGVASAEGLMFDMCVYKNSEVILHESNNTVLQNKPEN